MAAAFDNMDQMKAELERLKAENAKLKKEKPVKGISFKVSEKGALSVYGLGRFPVTLYKGQWHRLLERVDDLKEFMEANDEKLLTKA
jgi:hypothetical protein